MNANLIFVPVIAQVLLTLFVFIGLAVVKARATKQGEVDEERRALHADAWPDSVLKFNNNISNQFELPVLFYVLCITTWALGIVNTISLSLACLFVLSRVVHVIVHTGSNYVPIRRKIFMLGFLILLAMAIYAMATLAQYALA